MWSLSSTSACYFLLLWEQTTFAFSCSLINKKHFYMGGLEWPVFSPPSFGSHYFKYYTHVLSAKLTLLSETSVVPCRGEGQHCCCCCCLSLLATDLLLSSWTAPQRRACTAQLWGSVPCQRAPVGSQQGCYPPEQGMKPRFRVALHASTGVCISKEISVD